MASALVRAADPLAATDGVLPSDVLYEVLLRVPTKALCRLRLVCRSWRSLTSDPRFARAHTARHPLFVALQLRHAEIHIVDLSGNIVKRIRGVGDHLCMHLSMQAGLVCVSTLIFSSDDNVDAQDLVLNLATGAVNILPDGNRSPLVNSCIIGHVPSTGEHKVLRMSHYYCRVQETFRAACEVITLGGSDQRWKRTKPSPVKISAHFRHIAVVHGVAYFWSFESSNGEDSSMVPDIALFNLATEERRPTTLRGPLSLSSHLSDAVYYEQDIDHVQFAGLGGCLVIIHHKNRDCSTDLWFLMDVDSGFWTKRYSMRCAPHWKRHGPSYSPCPLVVLDDGRIVAWLEGQFVLRSYDPRTNMWADLDTLEYYFATGMHQGSLLCSDLQGFAPSFDSRQLIDL